MTNRSTNTSVGDTCHRTHSIC